MLPSRFTKYQGSITGPLCSPNYSSESAVTRGDAGDGTRHGRESMFQPRR
jgi:hypothetical protein